MSALLAPASPGHLTTLLTAEPVERPEPREAEPASIAEGYGA